MKINITLAVQAVNFFIAYILLRYLLFKPAVRELHKEEMQEIKMQEKIAAVSAALEVQKKEHQTLWHHAHQFFIKNRPSLSDKSFSLRFPSLAFSPLTHAQKEDATRHLKDHFVTQLRRVP